MNARLILLLIAVFAAGLLIGRILPRFETVPLEPPEISLSPGDEGSGPVRRASGGEVTARQKRAQNSAGETMPVGPESDPTGEQKQSPFQPLVFQGFDAQGELTGIWPAVSLGEDRVLLPAPAVRGAVKGVVEATGALPLRVTQVYGLGDRGLFAVVKIAAAREATRMSPLTIADGQSLWYRSSESDRLQPAVLEARLFHEKLRLEVGRLSGTYKLEAGGFALDDVQALVGLVLPATADDAALMLEVRHFAGERLQLIELTLADYYGLYFEGTVEALLKKARHELENRRFGPAVDTFRIVIDRRPALMSEIRDEFLAALVGRLEELPLSTAAAARFAFLQRSVADIDDEGTLWFELARAAAKIREYEDALTAWDTTWRLTPDLVGDLKETRNRVWFDWAETEVGRGQFLAALDVIARAVSDTGGSAELFLLQSRLLLRERRYLEAAAAMRDAISLDPSLAAILDDKIARAERLADGPGRVIIDFPPGSRAIYATVQLNGKASGTFVVDTGATTSMVPTSLANRAGLDTSERVPRVKLETAGNTRIVPYSPVSSLSLGALSVSGISVVVGDLSGGSGHGLLGMDFLGRFHIETDAQNGRMVLTERR